MTAHPTGTVTFLFTDIENSTKLALEHPETWEAAKSRHHAILQEAIESNNGFVFQIIGDAFCAAFHTASDALNAAVEAQRRLQMEEWGDSVVKVRMGLHTGSAELHENEYRGYLAMAKVQRIISVAYGDQVLLSNTTSDLLHNELPMGITLRDLKEHQLKGLPDPERLWQVVALDLPSDFPPLQSARETPNNLPLQLTSYIGREKEITEVIRLLENQRMVTLLGPGGIGKTRLSIEIGKEILRQYPDGIWMVEFAPIFDPLLIPRTTAIAMGLREEPQHPVLDMLCDYLRDKQLLLILDNCEHLIEDCAQLADTLLHASLQIRVLATSREILGVGGEISYLVPSLKMPDIQNQPILESLSQFEAVRLFAERASAKTQSFTVTAENVYSIAQICRRLDGIPLAIELAAAKIRALSTDQIAQRLDDRFRLLTDGDRMALPRHQTLRATVEWSYNLLQPTEQTLYRRLSVFLNGWTLEAAESVCSDKDIAIEGQLKTEDILELLNQLVNKSLVMTEERHAEIRYYMLETIRQYAADKLSGSGEIAETRNSHLNYFLELAQFIDERLLTVQRQWLPLFELEQDNFRIALKWALETKPEVAQRLVGFMGDLWFRCGYLAEGRNWCQMALATRENILHEGDEIDQARAESFRTLALMSLGYDPVAARIAAQEGVALARKVNNIVILARALQSLGAVLINQGEHQAGQVAAQESVTLARRINSTVTLTRALQTLGLSYAYLGNLTRALDSLHECEAIARQMDYKVILAHVLRQLAGIVEELDEPNVEEQLHAYWEESLTLSYELGDTRSIIDSEWHLTLGELYHGDLVEAKVRIERLMDHFREMGDKLALNQFLSDIAHTWRHLGNFKEAIAIYRETIVFWLGIQHRGAVAHQLECFAYIAKVVKSEAHAVELLSAADGLREACAALRTPIQQKEFTKEFAELRGVMEEAIFKSLWVEGRSMTIDRAVEFALESTAG